MDLVAPHKKKICFFCFFLLCGCPERRRCVRAAPGSRRSVGSGPPRWTSSGFPSGSVCGTTRAGSDVNGNVCRRRRNVFRGLRLDLLGLVVASLEEGQESSDVEGGGTQAMRAASQGGGGNNLNQFRHRFHVHIDKHERAKVLEHLNFSSFY